MSRRYLIAEQPVYSEEYDRMKLNSVILNPAKAKSLNPATATSMPNLSDETGLRNAITVWKEYLDSASDQIEAVKKSWRLHQKQAIELGHKPPKRMLPGLRDKMLEAEAKFDICSEEINHMEKLLKEFTDITDKASLGNVLQYGAVGSTGGVGAFMRHIDYQTVKIDHEGILRIKDNRSPYDGMTVVDYREYVVKPWREAQAKLSEEYYKKLRKKEIPREQITISPPMAPLPKRPSGYKETKISVIPKKGLHKDENGKGVDIIP